ncbi:S-DNA-T family DNA segregation ATPase FtsK/SpoIIIE [Amycolatopsis lexingtonensis]|uniref:S-DNA-T family DNA segregation ATPase FtsK/SpoIIIE n=1 Tax=Amycolatopsis lexingtonensis TaxID=218822 RepID=A0ABR9IHN0_9PSEU|nr:FtsK/SpoIIIE domain-containing protein [Amycolatopsis lexingtonensis]MBE1502675.1 S-DNA-T family DNA segregation ATPase FtsK/SpoIIIE [Amycolatopsis lexingtonensis]
MNPTDHDDENTTTDTTPTVSAAPAGELATVHHLPARPEGGPAIEGEIVTEEEWRLLNDQKAQRDWRYAEYRRQGAAVVKATRTAVTHDKTIASAKFAGRHAAYVLGGAGIVAKRAWEASTNSRYERLIRAAEARGDGEELKHWEERAELAKEKRHRRAMDWLDAPVKIGKALLLGALVAIVVLFGIGCLLAVSFKDAAMIGAPFGAVADLVRWVTIAISVAWGPLLLAAPWLGLAGLHHIGRRAEATPGWLARRDGGTTGQSTLVTADGIVAALRHLGIPAMNKAIKDGWTPRFELNPTREGSGAFKGYRAIVDLPMGVAPTMVADRREVLAKNLNRNAVEVWASDYGREKGGKAGYLNLYVADSGVMDKPTPEYPLLHDGSTDVFAGVPIGITQRGDVVSIPINGSNAVFGGQPGQGKSNAVRVMVLGVALDPLAEIRVHVFAMNGDFDAYEPRLSSYEKGATTEHVESALAHLEQLYAEVGRREGRLAELGAKKLTRAISEQHDDMRPLFVGFSECHELFGHGEYGKQAAELAVNIVKRGRKTGVSTVYDTQSSRADAIPSQLVENVGANGCFAVKTWRSNDGFLGDGSFAAGIRATELRFNVDRGTMIATGMTDELFEIVRTFFVEVDDDRGWDAAADVIARAMAQLKPGTPVAGSQPVRELESGRDLLEDVAEALGEEEKAKATDVVAWLRQLAPEYRPYQALNADKLAAQLGELGVKVTKVGVLTVYTERVRKALAERPADV